MTGFDELGFSWTPFDSAWEKRFNDFVEFKKKHGHCNVPINYVENHSLALWLGNQRAKFNRGALAPERAMRMTVLGVVWDMAEVQWREKFAKLQTFKNIYGHCNVTPRSKGYPELGKWAAKLRGRKSLQAPERIKQLDDIGFEWTPFEAAWEKRFNDLAEFKKKHGHCNVPITDKENHSLALWLTRQRARFNHGVFDPEQAARMVELGVVWYMPDVQWSQKFAELESFKRIYGHCNVPSGWKQNSELSGWVYRLRHRKSRMSEDQINQLDNLGFEWSFRKRKKQ